MTEFPRNWREWWRGLPAGWRSRKEPLREGATMTGDQPLPWPHLYRPCSGQCSVCLNCDPGHEHARPGGLT